MNAATTAVLTVLGGISIAYYVVAWAVFFRAHRRAYPASARWESAILALYWPVSVLHVVSTLEDAA